MTRPDAAEGEAMRRHSRSGDKPIKKRHSKTEKPKRRDPPKAARRYNSTDTSPEIQVARLTHELQASVARENATSEVLRIISSSPGELKPVFNAMLENAVRLCEAEFGNLFLYDGEAFHAAAVRKLTPWCDAGPSCSVSFIRTYLWSV